MAAKGSLRTPHLTRRARHTLLVVVALLALCVFLFSDTTYSVRAVVYSTVNRRNVFLKYELDIESEDGTPHPFVHDYPPTIPGKGAGRCFLGVASSIPLLSTLSKAALETWVVPVSELCDIRFFVGQGDIPPEQHEIYAGRIVQLAVAGDYPPIDKVFGMWSYMHSQRHLYQWFGKIDGDSYVNAAQFARLLEHLKDKRTGYYGVRGYGIDEQRDQLGLRQPYCLGLGHMVGVDTLAHIGPHLAQCSRGNVSLWDDVELGRCLDYFADLPCSQSPVLFEHLYYQTVGQHIVPSSWMNASVETNTIAYKPIRSTFPEIPNRRMYSAAVIHPLKRPEFFYRFHRQVTQYLRPPLPDLLNPHKCRDLQEGVCMQAVSEYRKTCVHNPSVQLEMNNIHKRECPAPSAEEHIDTNIPTFVLSLDAPQAAERFANLSKILHRHGVFDVRRFFATNGKAVFANVTGTLKPGELGYVDTMRRIIREARDLGLQRIIILDDDAMPHVDFGRKLRQALNDRRCGNHMFTRDQGGVVMLGCTIYSNGTYPRYNDRWLGGWNLADADRKNHTARRAHAQCFNVNRMVVGSYAAMYHRSTYDTILQWLEDTRGQTPFDWVYHELAKKGYIVRSLFPNLVVPDINHPSTTDPERPDETRSPLERAKVHRWDFKKYCGNPAKC
eukprot:comp23601_c0_seq1/m.40108 comp23601_c0_seq1/g.40108  ORF comp23601_c0_seq1/g.40108 comp23601_c0_seq1/m.40108 type:complete len:668 (-) comp23601_c0_seq1:119-2122(-)